jgi:hypothetical protein
VEALARAADTDQDAAVFRVAAFTGLRLGDQAAKVLDGLSRRERFTDADDLVFVDDIGGHVDDWRLRRRFHAALTCRSAEAAAARPEAHVRHDRRPGAPAHGREGLHGHADIATTMIYVHHVPQHDAADKLSRLVDAAQNPVSGHVRDTNAETGDAADAEILRFPEPSRWARLDSNQGPTDYESAALTS